ncbi:hypothetical protein [Pseudonocardia sp. NPDC046786]|uniref:hypothetical protein n=1 Tax=Pseudonocardia sp. NPDC046786 TaxID=3155471 RepID=UPI0034115398
MSTARIWGPVILQAAQSLVDHQVTPVAQDETETYWDIVFANGHQYAVDSFTARADESLDEAVRQLTEVLSRGWLRGEGVDSPQSVFTHSDNLRPIRIENPDNNLFGDKPVGAFWTSSYLPDGTSAWSRSENSEFNRLNRPLRNFVFEEPSPEEIFVINSPEDYQRLVCTYLRSLNSNQAAIDWKRAAEDLVAVRLSASGLALAHHFRVPTPAGKAQLSGWDAESTAWLRLPRNASLS